MEGRGRGCTGLKRGRRQKEGRGRGLGGGEREMQDQKEDEGNKMINGYSGDTEGEGKGK